jgi:hypothetical protein
MLPFVEHRIISSYDVIVERKGREQIDATITLWRGPNPPISLRYEAMWDEFQ